MWGFFFMCTQNRKQRTFFQFDIIFFSRGRMATLTIWKRFYFSWRFQKCYLVNWHHFEKWASFRRFDLDKTTKFVRDSMLNNLIWNRATLQKMNTTQSIFKVWKEIICWREAENVSSQNSSMSLLIFSSNQSNG